MIDAKNAMEYSTRFQLTLHNLGNYKNHVLLHSSKTLAAQENSWSSLLILEMAAKQKPNNIKQSIYVGTVHKKKSGIWCQVPFLSKKNYVCEER